MHEESKLFVCRGVPHPHQFIRPYELNLTDNMVGEMAATGSRIQFQTQNHTDFRTAILPSNTSIGINMDPFASRDMFYAKIYNPKTLRNEQIFGYFLDQSYSMDSFGLTPVWNMNARMQISSTTGGLIMQTLNGSHSAPYSATRSADWVHVGDAKNADTLVQQVDSAAICADMLAEESENPTYESAYYPKAIQLGREAARINTSRNSIKNQLIKLSHAVSNGTSMLRAGESFTEQYHGNAQTISPEKQCKQTFLMSNTDQHNGVLDGNLMPGKIITLQQFCDLHPTTEKKTVASMPYNIDPLNSAEATPEAKANVILSANIGDLCNQYAIGRLWFDYDTAGAYGVPIHHVHACKEFILSGSEDAAWNLILFRLESEVFPIIRALCEDTEFQVTVNYDMTSSTMVNVRFRDNHYDPYYQNGMHIVNNRTRGLTSPVLGTDTQYRNNRNMLENTNVLMHDIVRESGSIYPVGHMGDSVMYDHVPDLSDEETY